jgi:hypothetical protein
MVSTSNVDSNKFSSKNLMMEFFELPLISLIECSHVNDIDFITVIALYFRFTENPELGNFLLNKQYRIEESPEMADEIFKSLEYSGYIRASVKDTENKLENYTLRESILRYFPKKGVPPELSDGDKFMSLVNTYRNMFPPRYKGDRIGVNHKMKEFLKDYPEYGREVILKATELYLSRMKRSGYTYLRKAHYFIRKDKVSDLADYCEQVLETGIDKVTINDTNGISERRI